MPSEEFENRAGDGAARRQLSFSVAEAGGIGSILPALDEFLTANSIAAPRAQRVRLVVEELVANAFLHGSAESTGGVAVVLRLGETALGGTVCYIGRAFDPSAPLAGRDVDTERVGGQGVRLVQGVTSRLEFSREGESNRVDFEVLGG